jgi:peroxiredoxin
MKGGGSGENIPACRPFQADGHRWIMTNLTANGSFQFAPCSEPPKSEAVRTRSAGKPAPGFTAQRTDGQTVHFPGDYKGKVVLLDFWATWCGPCVAEIPHIVKVYDEFQSQGLAVLGISLDRPGAAEKLAAFTQDKHMRWPQVYDGQHKPAPVAELYGIDAIPHLLLVDGDTGLILSEEDIRGEKLAGAVQKALKGKKL